MYDLSNDVLKKIVEQGFENKDFSVSKDEERKKVTTKTTMIRKLPKY